MSDFNEPWRQGENVEGFVFGVNGSYIGETGPGLDSRYCARIVACVNACKGIPSSSLEAGVIQEMAEALEGTALSCCEGVDECGYCQRARILLAKLEAE